jgi:nitrogen fixation protein NifU and related proteins
MEKNEFDFWQDHAAKYLEMAFRSDKCEIVERPDGYGKNTGDCGDTVEFFITLNQDRIQWISFAVNGCINTRACANTVVMMAEGKTVAEAWKITPDHVIQYLETLPPESEHCAELAVGALYLALSDCQKNKQEPWRKLYPK